jgi:hypothetical protein
MGAEFGDTIATIRSETTELPNPMLSSVWSIFPPIKKVRATPWNVGMLEYWKNGSWLTELAKE